MEAQIQDDEISIASRGSDIDVEDTTVEDLKYCEWLSSQQHSDLVSAVTGSSVLYPKRKLQNPVELMEAVSDRYGPLSLYTWRTNKGHRCRMHSLLQHCEEFIPIADAGVSGQAGYVFGRLPQAAI